MPQQPATLELTATISDKTFPISSFTINIPINVTHNEVTNYKAGGTYTTLITPKPPSTDELITRFTNAIKALNNIRNQPRRGRGGEILKTTPSRPMSRVVALPLPDNVFC